MILKWDNAVADPKMGLHHLKWDYINRDPKMGNMPTVALVSLSKPRSGKNTDALAGPADTGVCVSVSVCVRVRACVCE